jgi:putative heme iron utilization protein
MKKSFLIMSLMCMGIIAQAQMIIVPREKLDAVNNPRLSEKSTSFRFETVTITAATMNEDEDVQAFVDPFENVDRDTLKIG